MTKPVCIVTGANTGIGEITAVQLAERGYRVLLACRSRDKTERVLSSIVSSHGQEAAQFIALDLSDLRSVRRAAEEIISRDEPVSLLVNNAGLVNRGLTADGFEICFGVNHLGPYLFTRLLLPILLKQKSPKVVCVASKAHYRAKKIPFDTLKEPTKSVTGLDEYSVSKLANILFAKELATRFGPEGLSACSLHPGVIASEIWRRIPNPFRYLITRSMITVEEGAKTSIFCATQDLGAGDENGLYYDKCKVKRPSHAARDRQLAAELWAKSAEYCEMEP